MSTGTEALRRRFADLTSVAAIPRDYADMLIHDGHDNLAAFLYAAQQLIGGTDLRGKRVLEIGSGRGLMALYVSLRGAARVVSMEPELVGARSGVIALQRERLEKLHAGNVDIITADFNEWEGEGARFDVILSRASINHLYDSRHHALHDPVTYANYLRIARKIHGLLAPGGVFIATDACRYAFFSALRKTGIRRPWRRRRSNVNWRVHQNPGTWKKIFREAGFTTVAVDYPVPYRLRHVRPLANTAVANFFLRGAFILRASR